MMVNKDYYCRDFQPEDYFETEKLWLETGVGNPARGDHIDSIKNTLKLGGKLIVLVQKSNEKIIGTSWLTYDGRRIYLHHFAVLPEFQGKRLSYFLLEESLKYAREKNTQIKLEVHIDNEIAQHLYRKAGFKYLGDYQVLIIRDI